MQMKFDIIMEVNLPMMMNKNKLMTINNWATIHWAVKSKIKNEYKQLLKEWFLDETVKLPEDIHFIWQPIYKDNRKRDSINNAAQIKVIEDSMVELGILTDDNKTSHTILPGKSNKALSNHIFELKICKRV